MNELAVRTLVGEVFGPRDSVRVVGRPKPFQAVTIDESLPSGLTVDELIDKALGGHHSNFADDYYVCVDGQPVPREWRSRVRVKGGATVTFSPRFHKDSLKSVLMIALAVVALVVMPFLTPILGTVLAGIVTAGIVIGGSLALNALFPTAPAATSGIADQTEGVSKAYTIAGTRNTADPFGPIPCIYGRMRVWPRYGAQPYTEYSGNNQYLRLLFVLGYGPMTISDLRIGQTPIGDLEGVSTSILEGTDPANKTTLYPGQVLQETFSIDLTEDEWNERTTAEEIDEISVDIVAPNGLYQVLKKNGKYQDINIKIRGEYRVSGSADPWTSFISYDKDKKEKKATRFTFKVDVTRGQYDVRVRRTDDNDDDDGPVVDDLVWVALTGIRDDPPISFHKPLAMVAMRIKASGQLNNIIDSFNCLVSARMTAWNGSSWVTNTASRNPAAAFRWVLQGPGIHETVPDEQIDLESLQGWYEYCTSKGWEYNFEHDRRMSVFDTLKMIAASGRARVTRVDGKWGVIWDEADVPVAQHFTPRNSWGFEEQRVYFDPPHAYRVAFINEQKDYTADERRVYDDGFNSGNATTFEALEFPGCTHPDKIYRLARFHMAQNQLRPATYTLMTNWQALSCTVGDKVYVAHDVTLWGLAQARVIGVNGDVITLDSEVTFELGFEYRLRFRQADGTSVLRDVAPADSIGNTKTITLDSDIDLPDPQVGDLVMFGTDEPGPAVLLRVLEIEWMPDLRARVTLVDDAPEIANADTGAIPDFDSQITVPADLFARAPTNVSVKERIYVQDGAAFADANISWLALPTNVTGFEVEIRNDSDSTPEYQPLATVAATDNFAVATDLDTGTYSFRVRSLFTNGGFSGWAEIANVTFAGVLSRPDDITNFKISVLGDSATLSWDPIFGQGVAFYTIRHTPATVDASWGSATILLGQVVGASAQVPAINGTFLIKAFTLAETESLSPAQIIYSGQNIILLNSVEVLSPHEFSPVWDGTLTDLTIDTATDALFLDGEDEVGTYVPSRRIDLGEVFTSRVSAELFAFGDNAANTMDTWVTLLSVDNLAGSTPADWAVLLEERHTSDNPMFGNDSFTKVLLHFDGTDASTTITDENAGGSAHTWTANGNAQIDTGKFYFSGASLLCDGTGDYVDTPDHADFALGAGDFTIDCWIRRAAIGAQHNIAGHTDSSQTPASSSFVIWVTSGNKARLSVATSGGFVSVEGTTSLAADTWYHVAGVRTGNVIKIFVNGVEENSNAFNFTVPDCASKLAVGRSGEATANAFNGSIDEFRLSVGVARWTEDFIVPTSPWEDVDPTWTDWTELRLSDITARAYEFRFTLSSFNPGIDVVIDTADIFVDMPDRIDALGDLLIPDTGTRIDFSTPFRQLQTVVVTAIQDAGSGDYATVTSRDESGFNIIIKNSSNVGVERTIDAVAAGYGRQIG